jgi:eukaryotic-like serine/threonine-protein kinase
MRNMDLEPFACEEDAFEVVRVIPGSSDPEDCAGTEDGDWAVGYPSYDLTLCLSYHFGQSAYHAEEGDCVYGQEGADMTWEEEPCETGNFYVVARLENSSSWDDCDAYDWDYARSFSVTDWPALDLRLCLAMNYPDDAGRAEVDNCLLMTGPENDPTFEFADCDASNVYVTGRTSEYSDDAFCGNDAWTSWQNEDHPDMGYTVCWRWL